MYLYRLLGLVFGSCLALSAPEVSAAPASPAIGYAGTISVMVDATDTDHRIFNVTQRIPVKPGSLTLWLPQWLPGTHAPTGPINQLAGLIVKGNGKRIEWTRDTIDISAFKLDVPSGVRELEVSFQTITSVDENSGRVVMTPTMFNLQWIATTLYPAGYDADRIMFKASLKVPAGWKPFTALEVDSQKGDTYHYKEIDFANLADSPVFGGKYYKTFDLDPGAKVPVRLNVVADDPRFLEVKPDHLVVHRNLVKQAYKLFNSRHYDHYDFLFALSKQMSRIGLEHHRSSENALPPPYFTEWDPKIGSSGLLPHEFVHSWNGKFRRPLDLTTPHFNVPMQDTLLWVYEGQTDYWGEVLTGRSGLRNMDRSKDTLAMSAALYGEGRPGLSWRSLQDTTNDAIIGYRSPRTYVGWQLRMDYYDGASLMWLEADVRLRSKSAGTKSLDDFAKAFFGVDDGIWAPKTYTFDDVVKTLNAIVPDDWASFLRGKLDGHGSLLDGIEASGWRLVFKDTPNEAQKAAAKERGGADYIYSLGFAVDKEGKIADVRWDGPAFRAGVGVGMNLIAVNERAYEKDYLEDAIRDTSSKRAAPIKLLVKDFNIYRTITVDYKGGLRHPHLERIEGKTDYLTPIFAPRP